MLLIACGDENRLVCVSSQEEVKYQDVFTDFQGQDVYFDFDQALQCASELDKNVLVVFGAWGSKSFKEFTDTIFADARISEMIAGNFISVVLYVDDRSPLPGAEQFRSAYSGDVITTLGHKNADIQIELLKSGNQPKIALIDKHRNVLSEYTPINGRKESFVNWLAKLVKSSATSQSLQ